MWLLPLFACSDPSPGLVAALDLPDVSPDSPALWLPQARGGGALAVLEEDASCAEAGGSPPQVAALWLHLRTDGALEGRYAPQSWTWEGGQSVERELLVLMSRGGVETTLSEPALYFVDVLGEDGGALVAEAGTPWLMGEVRATICEGAR